MEETIIVLKVECNMSQPCFACHFVIQWWVSHSLFMDYFFDFFNGISTILWEANEPQNAVMKYIYLSFSRNRHQVCSTVLYILIKCVNLFMSLPPRCLEQTLKPQHIKPVAWKDACSVRFFCSCGTMNFWVPGCKCKHECHHGFLPKIINMRTSWPVFALSLVLIS